MKRINKATARKLFREGKTIYLTPCKADQTKMEPIDRISSYPFDLSVNIFEMYFCDSEVGYYAHYYVKED